jgi:restriction system protein
MGVMWGIHNDKPEFDFLAGNFIALGWPAMPDLTTIGPDKEEMKRAVAAAYPTAKPNAIPIWAGLMRRFAFEMQPGDLVVYPQKTDSTVNIGRVEGPYRWEASEPDDRHRRTVRWLKTGVPRATLSKSAGYEIGSAVTLFKVRSHVHEFEALLGDVAPAAALQPADAEAAADEAIESAENEPNAERIEDYTRDFVIKTLATEIDGHRFEHFVAQLLRTMGYRATVTPPSGDGGFDVLAHRDPLGLEPPIIKVQCKRTLTSITPTEVQALTGALAPGGQELGLFVTLGGYSKDALNLGRNRQDPRLVNGSELVALILEHYERFLPEWKRILPMRSVYVVDREPEDG